MRILGQAVTGLALLFLLFSAYPLMAQPYPNQPIQLVITLAPGDSGDLTGRAIGVELSKSISTSVIPLIRREEEERWGSISWPRPRRMVTPFFT